MMGGLILLVILVPVIILILLATILNRSGEQRRLMESLYDKIKDLDRKVTDLSKIQPVLKEEAATALVFETPVEKIIVPEKTIIKEESPVVIIEEPVFIPEPVAAITTTLTDTNLYKEIKEEKPARPFISSNNDPLDLSQKNTDLEKFIGENLANKIGIAVLVLGIGFFVKYAIDKNWIGEAGRVVIGLICGGILIGLAHRFRNVYRSFSSVLVGGGLSVFYFSIAFAFHEYHLIGQTAAFIFMVLVSAFAVLLSVFYNRQELAILATIGGFITPFLVSTGQENYVALFTYLCILNAGLTALSWFKRWPAINIISLIFTTIIFGGWMINRTWFDGSQSFPYKDAFIFATLFYLLFVGMNIINSIRLKNKFATFDFIILLSVNFLYYAAGIVILSYWNDGNAKGVFTLSLGLFNLLLTVIFYRKKSVDRNFVFLLMGLALTFISLAAPVQYKGHHVTLFWAAESVVLLALYQRSKISLLKLASMMVSVLSVISLVIIWVQLYFSDSPVLPVVLNKGFITTLAVTFSLFIYYLLLGKEKEDQFYNGLTTRLTRNIALVAAISILYLSGVFEIYHQFSHRYTETPLHTVYLQLYSFIFAASLLYLFRKSIHFPLLKICFTLFSLAVYLFNASTNYEVSMYFLTGNGGQTLFLAHWIAAALLLWLLVDFARYFYEKAGEKWMDYRSAFTWVAVAGLVILLSIEMYHVILWTNFRDKNDWLWWENLYYKAGLSILWSISSFVLMWLGMKHNFRTLRIISLTLFTITLVKLFGYDISNIPPGGKIAAFILLGVLLLVVSFMYQRLKKIIIDDTAAEKNDEHDRV